MRPRVLQVEWDAFSIINLSSNAVHTANSNTADGHMHQFFVQLAFLSEVNTGWLGRTENL